MRIGLLGAGRMGSMIALTLIRAGHHVHVWNRTRSKVDELAKQGAIVARTPFDAASDADVLLSMLAHDDAIAQALFENDAPAIDGLAAGRTHVSMSTISPNFSAHLASIHHRRGQRYVAAPVLGRPEAAARGELVIVAAGSSDAIAGCEELFDTLGRETYTLGDDAQRANVVKLAVNFILAAMLEVIGEAYALVERYGVSDERFLEIANGSMLKSPVLESYGEKIARQTFEPAGFLLHLGLKDIHLALEAGEAHHLAMPVASVVRDRFLESIELGLEKADWSAMARAARKKAA